VIRCFHGIDRDCPLDQLDRPIQLSVLLGDDAKQMETIRVMRIDREYAPIAAPGFLQEAGLVL
jgi:hypothetical protein